MSSASVLDVALSLCRAGLAVHWLWPRSKVPASGSWQILNCRTPEQLQRSYRPGFNLGMRTGHVPGARVHLVAVDVDSAQRMQWAEKNLPPTPCRTLTHKGEHWLYLHPGPGVVIRNEVKIGDDIDVRGDLGNLVIPPSVHPQGFQYQAAQPWQDLPWLQLPVFQREWLPVRPAPAPAPVRAHVRSTSDNGRMLVRGERLARVWQTQERGCGQGTDTFKLAGRLLFALGMSADDAFEIMRSVYNPRCPEPYTDAELRRKVDQAAANIRDRRPMYRG